MSENMCPICLDIIRTRAVTDQCRHEFCFRCIERWSHNHNRCPVCRRPFHYIRRQPAVPQEAIRSQPKAPQIGISSQPTASQIGVRSHPSAPQIGVRSQPGGPQVYNPEEAMISFNTNTIINGGNIRIGRIYSQSLFYAIEFADESE